MSLSYDVISEFVKITNDKKEKPKEETVYATIVQTSDGKYVKIDGSDLVTPTETTTDIEDGERVTVLIKDHSAIITGNISSPSASTNRVNNLSNVVNEKIGVFETVIADKVDTNELHAYKAEIEHLIAGKAEIDDLKANTAEIKILNAEFANIKTLVNGNLTSDNILAFHITSDKVTMEDAFIKDAMIDTVNAAKINAGQLNTNMVSIGSSDGSMLINGSTQQFKDKNGNVRIQIGKDSTGDFTFVLYGEDGEGQIINQNGITASAVSDGLIVNDMVNDNAAISGGKLDISSVIAKINEDNSTTIESSKIFLDQENQSLEVAFGSLKTHVDTIQNESIDGTLADVVEKTQSNLTQITANTEGIQSLVSQSEIAKSEINDMKNNFNSTSTELSNKYTTLSQSLDGFKLEAADTFAKKTTVSDLENNLATNYTTTEAMNSAIEMNAERVALSVSEARIKDIKLGGANLLLNSDVKKQLDVPESGSYNHISYQLVDEYSGLTLSSDRTFVLSFIADRIDNLDLEGWDSIIFDDGWHHRWLREDLDKLIHVKDQTFKFVMKPKTLPSGTTLSDKLSFISENGYGGSLIYNVMLVEGDTAFDWQPSYSDIKTKMAQIEVNTDSIASTVAKQEIKNMQIGGENLFLGTTDFTPSTVWVNSDANWHNNTFKGCKVYYVIYDWSGMDYKTKDLIDRKVLKAGETYTFSCYVSASSTGINGGIYSDFGYTQVGELSTNWTQYSYTFTPTQSQINSATDEWTIRFEPFNLSGTGHKVYVACYKLERGNKATDYTKSNEDLVTSSAMNSAIEQKANEITSTVAVTKSSGVEMIPQSYTVNSTSGFTASMGNLDVRTDGLLSTVQSFIRSDFLPVDRTKPIYCTYDFATVGTGQTYIGFEQYKADKTKNGDSNASPIYWVSSGEQHTGRMTGEYTINAQSLLNGTRYVRLRLLTNWANNSSFQYTYFYKLSALQLQSRTASTQIAQLSDRITSTVSSISTVDGKVNKAQTQIDQQATQISSKVDANGVKSIIQQNPESVRIGFNAISNYFDLNSTRLQVGHSDGSYTQIGQDGAIYYASGSGHRYHNLIKQGWIDTIDFSGIGSSGWSATITLPSEFKNKPFSVIPAITYVGCPNIADGIKMFEINIPHGEVNYANGTFKVYIYASGLWAEGLSVTHAIQVRATWIAIA